MKPIVKMREESFATLLSVSRLTVGSLVFVGGYSMARKKAASLPKNAGNDWRDKVHFVDFSIEEENEIREWYSDKSPNWTDCLAEMLDSQWAVKISPPKGGDDWFVTGQFRGDGEAWDGHSFTVRYPDCETSTVILYYYVTVILIRSGFDWSLGSKARDWLK